MRTLNQIIEVLNALRDDLDTVRDARVTQGIRQSSALSNAQSYINSAESCIKAQLEEDKIRANLDITRWEYAKAGGAWRAEGKTLTIIIEYAEDKDADRGKFFADFVRNDGVVDQRENSHGAFMRWYMDLQCAQKECELWMRARGEWKGQ